MSAQARELDQTRALASGISHGLSASLGLRVYVQQGATPRTDGGTLIVPPPVSTSPKDVAAWHGYIDHECGHVVYTDREGGGIKAGLAPDEGMCLNILEDAYVNRRMADRFKGTAHNLKSVYDWHARKRLQDIANNPAFDPESPGAQAAAICNAVGNATGGPWRATLESVERPTTPLATAAYLRGEAWGREHKDRILARPKVADLVPLAKELATILREYVPPPPPEAPQPGASQAGSGGKGSPGEGQPGESGKTPGKGPGEGGDSEGEGAGSRPASTEDDAPEDQPETKQAASGSAGHGAAAYNAIAEAGGTADISVSMGGACEKEGRGWNGGGVAKVQPQGFARKTPPGPERIGLAQRCAAMGKGLANDLRQAVQSKANRRRVGDQAEGQELDDASLADVARRTPGVRPFATMHRATYPDTALVIVVDGSGSMSADIDYDASGGGGRMWDAAIGAAHALAQGIAVVPRTTLEVWATPSYGQTGGLQRSDAVVLLPFGSKPKASDVQAWASIYPGAGTECWGTCVRAAARKLVARPETRKICILVTDGGLTGADNGSRDRSDLYVADHEAAAVGVEVYGVAWGTYAHFGKTLPPERCVESKELLPSRQWLKTIAGLLLKGAKSRRA